MCCEDLLWVFSECSLFITAPFCAQGPQSGIPCVQHAGCACMSAVGVTAGVPVAAFATVVEGKGMNGNAAESGTDDEALQQRLAENDKVLRAHAWGDIDAPPDATLVEASEPLPNRKGFDPYKPAAPPPWEQPGQSAGGCLLM